MCIGGKPTPPQLPSAPPAAPTMADPAVQQARQDTQAKLVDTGLAATQLNPGLGGQGAGAKKLGGAPQ